MNYGPTETMLMGLHGLIGTGVILTGIAALVSRKGMRIHRLSGKIFVLQLCAMGLVIAASVAFATTELVSTLGILFTALTLYLVATSWATVKTPPLTLNYFSYAAPIVVAAIGVLALFWGWQAQTGRHVVADDIPVAAYYVFAAIALLAAVGDVSILWRGGIDGVRRLLRHLWRMCFALYFSVATLFTGPGSVVFPETIRGSWPLMIPEFSVVGLTVYFVVRLVRVPRQRA